MILSRNTILVPYKRQVWSSKLKPYLDTYYLPLVYIPLDAL